MNGLRVKFLSFFFRQDAGTEQGNVIDFWSLLAEIVLNKTADRLAFLNSRHLSFLESESE